MKEKIHDMFYGTSPIIHRQAKELRKRETKAEKILWSYLSNHQIDVKFRRQYPISQFIVDFYCHEIKLVVEVDGEIHHKQEQREYDQMRDEHLQSLGLHVMRFSNEKIIKETEKVLNFIQKKIKNMK